MARIATEMTKKPQWRSFPAGWSLLTRTEFEETADGFRDPRVWLRNESGHWVKINIWDHN